MDGNKPAYHFLLRLKVAVDYYQQNHSSEDIAFLVTGRWTSTTESFELTEAEAGKRFILDKIPGAVVIKEDISVELIGNYAFSKPLIGALGPDKVIIFTAEFMHDRNKQIASKIFADSFSYEFRVITKDLSDNEQMVEKERQASILFRNLFGEVRDGDDSAVRDKLLYETPYYFKGTVDDKQFFDTYWEGGYDVFLGSRAVRAKLPDTVSGILETDD